MKVKLLSLFVLLLFIPLYVVMHEFVHVIQYYLLYGDNLIYITMYFLDGTVSEFGIPFIAHTAMASSAPSIISNLEPLTKHLFYEIPAYIFNVLIIIALLNLTKLLYKNGGKNHEC